MTAREELAAVLAEHAGCVPNEGGDNSGAGLTGVDVWSCGIRVPFVDELDDMERAHLADALLASPALARVIREAKAEALREAAEGAMTDQMRRGRCGIGDWLYARADQTETEET